MPGDGLGHRVLDLQAGVHLEEVPGAVGAEQELDRAGARVPGRARRARRPAAPSAARSSASTAGEGASSRIFWWRRWSEQSRSPRWTHGAVGVGEDLHLDVAGAVDQPLEVDAAVAERGARPPAGPPRCASGERRRRAHGAHAAPAAARGGLHEQREAEPSGLRPERVVGEVDAGVAGRHRRRRPPRPAGAPRSCRPAARIAAGGGPTQTQPGRGDGLGELGALGQEAVAGVHGVGAGVGRGRHERGGVEVAPAPRRRRRRRSTCSAPALGRLVRRDRLDPELAAGARDPRTAISPRLAIRTRCDPAPIAAPASRGTPRAPPAPRGRRAAAAGARRGRAARRCGGRVADAAAWPRRSPPGRTPGRRATASATACVEPVGLDHLVHEPDPQRPLGVEARAGREQRAGVARADRAQDVRRDRGRDQARAAPR